MNWLKKLKSRLDPLDDIKPVEVDNSEAEAILENAKAALGEAQQRREEVRKVSNSLANLRARNHFGESIELAMMRRNEV